MSPLLLLLAAGVVSWIMRVMFITVVPADRLPARARDVLTNATPAVLAALTVVLVIGGLRGAGEARISHVVALVVAVVVARWKGNVTFVVFAAMAAAMVVQVTVPHL